MKYIRTKEGTILKGNPNRVDTDRFEIVKVADTIEELCDEFVYSDNVFKNVIYENYKALKMLLKIRKNYIVYGAIWTEWGLKYVARMNSKGVMELL